MSLHAQGCADGELLGRSSCHTPVCTGIYYTTILTTGDAGEMYQEVTTQCCYLYYSVWQDTGYACFQTYFDKLDPASQSELLALARTTNVLVRACNGALVPFRSVARNLVGHQNAPSS